MEIKYERIVEVNKGVTYTNVKGKNYAEVAQKVQAFRNLIPGGFITSEIIRFDPGIVYMKSEAGYYENGCKVVLSTGHAFERQDASNVNKTSYIENCETSAVGRALAFIGIGSESSISSVEELKQAIETQNAIAQGKIPDPQKPAGTPDIPRSIAPADVERAPKLPESNPSDVSRADPVPPVLEYFAKEREALRKAREISKAENNAIWKAQITALTNAGMIPNKPLSEFTQTEAERMIAAMYANFTPTGTVLKDESKPS